MNPKNSASGNFLTFFMSGQARSRQGKGKVKAGSMQCSGEVKTRSRSRRGSSKVKAKSRQG